MIELLVTVACGPVVFVVLWFVWRPLLRDDSQWSGEIK